MLPDDFSPKIGMMLGSGMGVVADAIDKPTVIPYGDVPGFPVSTVSGHSGELVCGKLCGTDVMVFKGRVHLYEGIDPMQLQPMIYSVKLLGCESFFVTSAVGSLRPSVGPGELVVTTDHINLQGRNPLVGPNDPIGPRFPSLMDAYSPKIRAVAHKQAEANGIPLHDGVYCSVMGPVFETPAEIRAFTTLGADTVGMSHVAETTLARHAGMEVFGMSVVVNLASGLSDQHITHEETLHFGNIASGNATKLIKAMVEDKSWHSW